MVIFRGINLDYFSKKNISEKKIVKLISDWKINKENFIIFITWKTYTMERTRKSN